MSIVNVDSEGYLRVDSTLLRLIKLLLITSIFISISFAAISSRLFSVIRFESIIHEFDPWFNFRATKYLVNNSFYEFLNWFDDKTWYPLGRVTGGTLYPGLMVTSSIIFRIFEFIGMPIDIRNICVLLAPAFSSLTSLAMYLLTLEITSSSKNLKNKKTAALLSAIFMGITPGYISRSVAGSYDNEAIAITLLMVTFYLWVKSIHLGSIFYACLTSIFYFYMVSAWGGYVFITNIIPLHVFILLLMGRFDYKIYTSYTTWYSLGTLMSMQIPFVGFLPIRSNDHMASFGVFGLLQLVLFANYLKDTLNPLKFKKIMLAFSLLITIIGLSSLILATKFGLIAPWTGRFYSLWDTNYAKIHIPIIASVSEHQPTPWSSFFFDLNFMIWLFPVGVYFCFQDLTNESVFIIVYSVLGSYFAGVMVRLMLTLAPVVCVCASISLGRLFDIYLDFKDTLKIWYESESETATKETKEVDDDDEDVKDSIFTLLSKLTVVLTFIYYLYFYVQHCTWVTSNAYSSPSVVLASKNPDGSQLLIDDYREAYYWLRMNTKEDAKIMAWWDYGYQIGGMADRTTFVDNNTWNNTHIATVGKAMSVNENKSEIIMRQLGVDYVLVIFGGLIGYSGDDINKFLWMVRISEGIWPEDVNERSYFTDKGEYRIDDMATSTMKESLMYKMSYYKFADAYGTSDPIDRVRQQRMSSKYAHSITLDTLEEAFTSENWIVRIYKLKDLDNFGRDLISIGENERKNLSKRNKRMISRKKPNLDLRV
ncbi:glycosyltransferase family 66 protein [[Candida] arabinofermentans NRRL YB-2248]|uniref:dolichyl-diphosphooligosaccharide--protein glycotransferase n=1 Tax=[Candida] arabinofermentans NRRL YB-2248 TaxID=983967 RepID=A0A1E4T039_9ASCO|nr:glycosyltransferase family 66 protein [[Candida] arabinofermentans NRRL YB-2248]